MLYQGSRVSGEGEHCKYQFLQWSLCCPHVKSSDTLTLCNYILEVLWWKVRNNWLCSHPKYNCMSWGVCQNRLLNGILKHFETLSAGCLVQRLLWTRRRLCGRTRLTSQLCCGDTATWCQVETRYLAKDRHVIRNCRVLFFTFNSKESKRLSKSLTHVFCLIFNLSKIFYILHN